jgi:hypothetical protein
MIPALVVAVASLLSSTGPSRACNTEKPGPNCPAIGVRHVMSGVVGGKRILFSGWHGSDGIRHYEPGENPGLDRALEGATGDVTNYGVNLPGRGPLESVGRGPRVRTDDGDFAEWFESGTDPAPAGENRPCPTPGPCPNPTPSPSPYPPDQRAADKRLMTYLAFAMIAAGVCFGFGALIYGLATNRKASP